MSDLRELYQTVILDHNKNPRNFGSVADASGKASGRFENLTGWLRTVRQCLSEKVVEFLRSRIQATLIPIGTGPTYYTLQRRSEAKDGIKPY